MKRVTLTSVVLLLVVAFAQAVPSEQAVTFSSSDGVRLAGTVFGSGHVGIVLSHMFPTDQTSWVAFGRRLAAEGYRALAYDFRGYGKSSGQATIAQIDRDVRAASDYLRAQGMTQLVLIGASMGGTASVKAAGDTRAVALVVLSSPSSFRGLSVSASDLARVTMPSLWITSEEDSVTSDMRKMYSAAGGPKALHVYAGDVHGTYLFESAHATDLTSRVLRFLTQYVPAR